MTVTRSGAEPLRPSVRRYSVHALRAAWWTLVSIRRARKQLADRGLSASIPPPPRSIPESARRGVDAITRRLAPTCLERALVQQTWLAAHGERCDIVVGVKRGSGEFAAHAWLDRGSDAPADGSTYVEITRIAAR